MRNLELTCTIFPFMYFIFFRSGCFWERQYAYYKVEKKGDGVFGRTNLQDITALSGYAGSSRAGANGQVCYHGNMGTDYSALGHAEVVQVQLDDGREEVQFRALIDDFFRSFEYDSTRQGMRRPDDFSATQGDHGAPYRSVVGIPGGVTGALYKVVQMANQGLAHPMTLKAGQGSDPDVFDTIYIMDSCKFVFFQAEQ